MTSPTATITGRVVGPDGLGRLGRLTLVPTSSGAPLPARDVVAGRVSIRIDTDGYLIGPTGRSVEVLPGDYEIDLNIPGDLGIHLRHRSRIAAGQSLTLADLLTAPQPPTPPNPPQPPVPPQGGGILTSDGHALRQVPGAQALEAANAAEVVDLGNGVLTWRKTADGLLSPGEHGVRYGGANGIIEAMDSGAVISPADGLLSWR